MEKKSSFNQLAILTILSTSMVTAEEAKQDKCLLSNNAAKYWCTEMFLSGDNQEALLLAQAANAFLSLPGYCVAESHCFNSPYQ